MIDIIIATNKKLPEIEKQMMEIKNYTLDEYNIIATCQDASAAVNRNYGIKLATSEIIVMIDDDVFGFYHGWLEDLTKPVENEDCIVSARFLKENGKLQTMMAWGKSLPVDGLIAPPSELPTSCIAFEMDIVKEIISLDALPFNKPFDEHYLRAEFEDTDFMRAAKVANPDIKFYVNNNCKLIHLNAESWRDESILGVNRAYFNEKWGENR